MCQDRSRDRYRAMDVRSTLLHLTHGSPALAGLSALVWAVASGCGPSERVDRSQSVVIADGSPAGGRAGAGGTGGIAGNGGNGAGGVNGQRGRG